MDVANQADRRAYVGMKFKEKLEILRDGKGWSQADLGSAIGVHQTRISKWEKGDGEPSMAQAVQLAKAFGVSVEYLADDDLDEPPKVDSLSNEEQNILTNAKVIGYPEAMSRILLKDFVVSRHKFDARQANGLDD